MEYGAQYVTGGHFESEVIAIAARGHSQGDRIDPGRCDELQRIQPTAGRECSGEVAADALAVVECMGGSGGGEKQRR